MKTCFMGSAICLDDTIRYSMLTSQAEDSTEQYGVLVEYRTDQVAIPDITTSKEDVQALITLLINGAVTPVSVQEIVEDWLMRD